MNVTSFLVVRLDYAIIAVLLERYWKGWSIGQSAFADTAREGRIDSACYEGV